MVETLTWEQRARLTLQTRRGRARSMTKTLCVSPRGKCGLGGHTQCSPRDLSEHRARPPWCRELQESLGEGCVRGAAKLESGSSAVLCEGATRTGDNSAGAQPTCKPRDKTATVSKALLRGQNQTGIQGNRERAELLRRPGEPIPAANEEP